MLRSSDAQTGDVTDYSNPDRSQTFAGDRRFAIQEQLGSGSMCLVYKVLDQQHGDVVALKTLKHLDSNSLYRLKQEFRALSSFDHPNLVSFYELVRNSQGWFVTMELVEGLDFLTFVRHEVDGREARSSEVKTTSIDEDDLRFHGSVVAGGGQAQSTSSFKPQARGLPDLPKLRSSLRQLAEGVCELHAAGRIHRDLKPSNVLITEAGRLVILDFGLVAEIDQDYTEGTLHQHIAGSAAYMSPEQSVGRPLTEANDWYSVGVMLYEALTGVWPFVGHLYQILTAKQQHDPVPPSKLVSGVPEDLDQLCMDLLRRDPTTRPTGADVLARLRGLPPQGQIPSLKARFRFREAQLQELAKAFQTARWGRTVVSLVRGGPGTGKSALVREFVKDIKTREDLITLKGRCYEWEKVPFKALDGMIDNLSRVLRRLDAGTLLSLSGEHTACLTTLFPVLRRVELGPDEFVESLPEPELRRLAFVALRQLIRQLCGIRPIVIHIDDAHWGDTDSAEALAELIRAERQLPMHVILSYRSDEPAAFMHWLLPVLTRARTDLRTVDLQPLDFERATLLASELLRRSPDDPEVRRAALESAGNPAALHDQCRAVVRRQTHRFSSQALTEVVVARVDGLPTDARGLLDLLAVVNRTVATAFAIHLAALGPEALQAITTLRALELLDVAADPSGESLALPSDALREYIYDRIPDERRRALHRQVGEALEQARIEDPELLVTHYAAGGLEDRAGVVAWLAAQRALNESRHEDATWLLDRAVTLGSWSPRERRSMLGLQGDALASLGRGEDAARCYERAVEEGVPDITRRRHLQKAAEQLIASGHVQQGLERLDGLITALRLPVLSGSFAGGRARFRELRLQLRGADFQRRRPEQVDPTDLLRVDVAWTASAALALVAPQTASRYRSVHMLTALDVGEGERVIRALAQELPHLAARDPSGATWRARFEEVLSEARLHGTPLAMGRLEAAAAHAAFIEGRYAEAVDLCSQADEVLASPSGGAGWESFEVRLLRLQALIAQGELRRGFELLDILTDDAMQARNLLYITDLVALGRAPLRLAEDAPDVAATELVEASERWASQSASLQSLRILHARTQVDVYRGRPGVGRERLLRRSEELAAAGLLAAPTAALQLDRVRATTALALAARNTERSQMLREATTIGRRMTEGAFLWAKPWGDLVLAAVEHLQGRPCLDQLAGARDTFAGLDMWLGAAIAGRQHALLSDPVDVTALDRAERWLSSQGIQEPGRLCDALGPGFSDGP